MLRRRAFLSSSVAIVTALASSAALASWLHEPSRVELEAPEPVVAHRETPPLESPRPMPRWDDETGRNVQVRAHHRAECRRGELDACDVYASMLASGVGGPADPVRALEVSRLACRRGHDDSCMYARGLRQRLGLPPIRLGEVP
jgi:TPR repeat protein